MITTKKEFFKKKKNIFYKKKIKNLLKRSKKIFLNLSVLKLKNFFKLIDILGKKIFKKNKLSRIKKNTFTCLKSLTFS